jgi:sec-independent protein translocase protein TatB
VFNLKGSEIVFLLLIALVVLGPEKLPDAIRKFGRVYGELRKMANGFQGELRQAFDEPMREIRGTADAIRQAANLDLNVPLNTPLPGATADAAAGPAASDPAHGTTTAGSGSREVGLDFGTAALKRQQRGVTSDDSSPNLDGVEPVLDSSAHVQSQPNTSTDESEYL